MCSRSGWRRGNRSLRNRSNQDDAVGKEGNKMQIPEKLDESRVPAPEVLAVNWFAIATVCRDLRLPEHDWAQVILRGYSTCSGWNWEL